MIILYNHIYRTGGNTVTDVLSRRFTVINDYIAEPGSAGFERWRARPVPTALIRSGVALVGHFTGEGCRPEERYPGLFADPQVFKVTILRAPRELAVSSYFYRLHNGECGVNDIATTLGEVIGIYARLFGIESTSDDVDAALARYDLIGLTEEMPLSLGRLAEHLQTDWRLGTVPRMNTAPRRSLTPPEAEAFAAFSVAASLDQHIYDAVRRRFFSTHPRAALTSDE